MNEHPRCAHCGSLLTRGGFCPRCAHAILAESGPESAVEGVSGRSEGEFEAGASIEFGPFDLIEPMPEQGMMGIVYRARHRVSKRVVALKLLRSDHLVSEEKVTRFQREVEAMAKLDHPGILPVYEVGRHHGQPYFSMKLIEQGSLRDQMQKGLWQRGPHNLRVWQQRIAALIESVARAVHHAHQRGILHRDLKPANILVDDQGQPFVSDFGLAKFIESGVEQTGGGLFQGTPEYSSPEQAGGRSADLTTGSDIWAIGVMLYELLTGSTPFRGDTPLALLKQVAEVEPKPPRLLHSVIDRDLETICLKCLEKEPPRRYASAEALAEDLRRYREGEPIQARSVTALERLWKWVRRRPALAGLVAAAIVVMGLGLVAVSGHRQAAASQLVAQQRTREARRASHAVKLTLSYQALQEGRLNVALDHLDELKPAPGEEDLRAFSWHLVRNLIPVQAVEFVDAAPLAAVHAVGASGGLLATVNDSNDLKIWDLVSRRLAVVFPNLGQSVSALAFSPDNRRLVSAQADGTLRLWNVESGRELRRVAEPAAVIALVWTAGSGCLGLDRKGCVRRWNAELEDGQAIHQLAVGPVDGAVFSSDGRWVALATETQLVLHSLAPFAEPKIFDEKNVHAMAFSPDGTRLAYASILKTRPQVRVIPGGEPIEPLAESPPHLTSVAFTGDGRRLLGGTLGGDIAIWDLESGKQLECWNAHRVAVHGVAASEQPPSVVSWSAEGRIRVYTKGPGEFERDDLRLSPGSPGTYGSDLLNLAFSADGHHLITCNYQDGLVRWGVDRREVVCRAPIFPLVTNRESAESFGLPVAFDGSSLVYWPQIAPGEIWNLADCERARQFPKPPRQVLAAALSPAGQWAATGDMNGEIELWRLPDGERIALGKHEGMVFTLAFGRDDRRLWLASGGQDGRLRIWDVNNRRQHLETDIGQFVTCVAFTPDGRTLAAATEQGEIGVRRASDGALTASLRAHSGVIGALAFSPDGLVMASGGMDAVVQIWELWVPSLRLKAGQSPIVALAFSPQGDILATASAEQTVRLWSARRIARDASTASSGR